MSSVHNDNRGGVQAGVAVGHHAQALAAQLTAQIRQTLPPTATPSEEFAALVSKVRALLQAAGLGPEEATEAEATVSKIEREVAKPSPNKDRVSGWMKVLESVSQTASYVLAGAKVVKDLIG